MFSKYIDDEPYVIAEVGQNHQGELDKAIEFIRIFAYEGADAVKFQTRNNKYLFAEEAYNKKYDSDNAFEKTYGAHREKLELDIKWLPLIKEECKKHGVDFMSTPFDEPSLNLLEDIGVDIIKVASFDLGNLPFLNKIAQTKKPIVMSIGGGAIDQIRSSVEEILKIHDDLALLHCVSEYPCEFDRLGLENIKDLKDEFPLCTIGSSDHFNGTLSGPVAYMQGARVFEKHVTLNRAWKGTDHSFALEPGGFRKFTRDIKRVRHMLPPKPTDDLGNEYVFQKLGKSLIPIHNIKAGEVISIDDLSGKIFNEQHLPVRNSNLIIGKRAKKDILKDHPILLSDIE
jgi:N-acetylneuraminate synthase/sialic acid synthase|tara:strand:+ start:400 stop:1425 length:1026 start_codon:yes stop_codon:yes gene_type:complete